MQLSTIILLPSCARCYCALVSSNDVAYRFPQIIFVNHTAITLATSLPPHVIFPRPIFVSYEPLTRTPVRVSASPVLLHHPVQASPAAPSPTSILLNSAFVFVHSPPSTPMNNSATYMPCPSIIINPTGMNLH